MNEADDEDDADDLKISNTPLMKGLFEAIYILWTVSDSQLKKVGLFDWAPNYRSSFLKLLFWLVNF